jgi:hypothetical protein
MTGPGRVRLMWAGLLVAWLTLVVAGLALLGIGLDKTFYLEPTGEALAGDRVGNLIIMAGSVATFAAAALARWMHTPTWVCILVATPAVLIGGLTVLAGDTSLPHLSALVGFPVGLAGLISGLMLARPFPRQKAALTPAHGPAPHGPRPKRR